MGTPPCHRDILLNCMLSHKCSTWSEVAHGCGTLELPTEQSWAQVILGGTSCCKDPCTARAQDENVRYPGRPPGLTAE
jgi:hypothetical protein